MYLVTAATEFEMKPFLTACRLEEFRQFITGVGPVETSVRLMGMLQGRGGQFKGVVNFGVAGAYIDSGSNREPGLLDVCLAEKEVFGDLGICLNEKIEKISGEGLEIQDDFVMDSRMLGLAAKALETRSIPFRIGNFVTVSCATGTARRGAVLANQYQGICENMEGAAVARVCREFDLPCLEVRCVSNLVEDRDTSRWKLKQACKRSGEVASLIVQYLVENSHG